MKQISKEVTGRLQQFGSATLAALAVLACGGPEPAPPAGQEFLVVTSNGAPVREFLATATFGDQVESLSCPEGRASGRLRCADRGFDVVGAARPTRVTLRSRGNAFSTTTLEERAPANVTLRMEPLAPADVTENYATRLDGPNCLANLQQLGVPLETDLGTSYSVKFYARNVRTTPEVYFQNTKKHPLHYEFAREVLGVAGSATEFATNTYTGLNRTAMAGTLVFYPAGRGKARGAVQELKSPWTINFAPNDDLTEDQVRLAHRLVEERLTCLSWTGANARLAYLPATGARETQASEDDAAFAQTGVSWVSRGELFGGMKFQPLNPGLAYGILKRLTPEELKRTPVSFRDVLLLTRLPNELPLVGGTITEEFQTPLAHVNVAARGRGTPNLAYPNAFEDDEVKSLLGKLVRFEVANGKFTLTRASSKEARKFWESSVRERFVPTYDASVSGILSFANVGFADWKSVGTKAANLAELTHVLGKAAPSDGLAVPFFYYQDFMASNATSAELCDAARGDCVDDGRSAQLCERARATCWASGRPEAFAEYAARLVEDRDFNQDTSLREALLDGLRYSIEHTSLSPELATALDTRIAEVFGEAKVKLRSSTNTEDLPDFSGAGLYSSYGAYASGEKAASKVLPKVFSSVWSFRAFEERAFWNIDHGAVRMGCAINQAFVDELANGVLITANVADPTTFGMYVNVQKGDAEVTNPEDGQLPEVFSILGDTNYEVVRTRYSSLSPDTPILSQDELKSLYDAGERAQEHFAKLYKRSVVLDMEFKLTPAHQIVFKQARPYVVK